MKRRLVFLLLSLCLSADLFAQASNSDFRFSYVLLKGTQVSTSIPPGGSITFPDTVVNLTNPTQGQTNAATFSITNAGVQAGTVNNITVTGTAFRLSGVPLLPITVQPNQTVSFTISFQPTELGRLEGALRVDLVTPVTFSLVGNGVGPVLLYDFVIGASTQSAAANDTLTMPQTNIAEKSTATIRMRNIGNFDAVISAIASSDTTVFPLENVPFLPLTLPAGNSASFNISFTPTQAGTLTARLRIGDVFFNLTGVGLGPTLAYRAIAGSASTTLTSNSTVIFTPSQIGSTSSLQIQISNTGNTAASINSISVAGPATGVFTLTNLPALPVRIDGGATISFGIAFAPITLGQATGTLRIDTQTFNLAGVGNAPPPLPGVSFSGAGSAVDAAQQIGVGISLDNPYPVQLDGKLVLTFSPTADVFSDDPAIAFASGGRTVNFTVLANSRNAVFGLNDSQIRFQTGTVAGTITLVASFATTGGGINLTVNSAPAMTIAVRPAAPRITSVQLATKTASGFTVLITGYSPTRSLTAMDFTFTPFVDPANKDLKLDTTSVNLPVSGPFNVWYSSTASQTFGSLFTAVVTFNVRGSIEAIQSLAVTANNSLGTSNSRSVTLR